jgi:exopolysaccharide biosynthesis polyprenyl glycosylphosphotransferase
VVAVSFACTLARHLEADGKACVIGFADDEARSGHDSEWAVLGRRDAIPDLVRQHQVEEIIVAYAPSWQQTLMQTMAKENPAVTIRVVPSVYEVSFNSREVDSVGDIVLFRLIEQAEGGRDVVKRLFDIVTAAVGLVLLSPFTLLVALLIKLSSRGPVIFRQERIGRGGRPFILYKFRTMVPDAESKTGPVLANGTRDNRLTGIGRWLRLFRMDEIPQLWNVLRGEMSLVGPRPERPFFVEQFEREIPGYAKRHQVRPGITGLAQVYGGYHTDARDKLRFDLLYVTYRSVWFDLTILLQTVLVVVFPRGGKQTNDLS